MSEDLKSKLDKMILALDDFQPDKPLPISIKDLHFIIGACQGYEKTNKELEESYIRDTQQLSNEVAKWREKWKNARQLCASQDNKIMRYKSIVTTVKRLPAWRKSKGIKLELDSLDKFESKHKD